KPDEKYTYGYKRYSTLGAIITTAILLVGSVVVIYHAVLRLINPTPIDYNGVLIFAVVGLVVNSLAVFFTHGGHSRNQKAVSLHMLEDVLGWAVVLVGAIVMRFTGFYLLDPILSICVALFILVKTVWGAKDILDLFLIKTPRTITVDDVRQTLEKINGIIGVHHIHVWAIDENTVCASLHAIVSDNPVQVKHDAKSALHELGIDCITVETETADEPCHEHHCHYRHEHGNAYCHHHHH
ncbi:MAG: cation diffusion facilitator family transporter, partial [Clostridia bacterium]|nr:cation diffusion facilitator family transporter [Clostridia bacterium]